MEAIGAVAGTGWASGINLYLVALMLGIAGRAGWGDVPEVFTRTDVMVVAGVLLIADVHAWAYFGLVGGGMYLYF